MLYYEARILEPLLASHAFEIHLPTLPVGRIRQHEIELARGECIIRERRVLWPANNIVRCLTFTLKEKVGLRDSIRLRVNLLAIEMSGHLLTMVMSNLLERLFRNGQHATRATGTVIEQVRA